MTIKEYALIVLFLSPFFLTFSCTAQVQAAPDTPLRLDGVRTNIVLPSNTIPSEETAAKELQHYLTEITGGNYQIVHENSSSKLSGTLIYVGPTQFAKKESPRQKYFSDEEWQMQTISHTLILDGGRPRGTLYAVYHFLEDVCGVHWWNPWEETVPHLKVLSIPVLDKRGQPAFNYRDVHRLYANDDAGKFMARSRLDRQGDDPVTDATYGGSRDYGPPHHVHTFYLYMPPEKYFAAHPDWFEGMGKDAPTVHNSQLEMSNPEMRKEFLKLLLENIRTSRAAAIANHLPPPNVFDVSQNDNMVSFVGSPADAALVKENGGAESAILLSFVNYLADGIKNEFPHVYIDTIAYFSGEKAPTNITARDNVIVRLTNTHSNELLPITAERNHVMRENIENWAKHCKNLRVWDYAVSYRFPHLPLPNLQTYAPDFQFYLRHNVTGVFVEFDRLPNEDMRDMKLWILCKLMENPNQNYDALVKEFTDGYYGAAGIYIRQYLMALQDAARKSKADVDWQAYFPQFNYLTTDFLEQANGIYTNAMAAVQDDPVLSQRVANARTSVDLTILLRYRSLLQEWKKTGNAESAFPLDRQAAGKRYLQAMEARINQRVSKDQQVDQLQKVQGFVEASTAGPAFLPPPAKFKNVPTTQLFTYSAGNTRNNKNLATVITDKDAESGYATRYNIPDALLARYKLPMQWGIYDTVGKKTLLSGLIKTADVPGAGYHWYKLGDVTLTSNDYLYFTWSWLIQNDVNDAFDPKDPNAKYEVWADIKFEGPAFPFGNAADKNAISVERIAVMKK